MVLHRPALRSRAMLPEEFSIFIFTAKPDILCLLVPKAWMRQERAGKFRESARLFKRTNQSRGYLYMRLLLCV